MSPVLPPPKAVFTRKGVERGVRDGLPQVVGLIVFAFVLGVLSQRVGLSFLENLTMSSFVYAGAAQAASLDLWTYPLPVVSIVLTTLLINLRWLLSGASVRTWLEVLPPRKVYPTLSIMTDQGWSIAMIARYRGEQDIGYFLGANLVLWLAWVPTTAAGFLLGGGVGNPATIGLDFAFTIIFTANIVSAFRGRMDVIPWAVAAGAALLSSYLIPGTWYVMIGGLAGFVAGILVTPDGGRVMTVSEVGTK